jgi:hypothetical protein
MSRDTGVFKTCIVSRTVGDERGGRPATSCSLQYLAGELQGGLPVVDTGRALENLHHGTSAVHFQHLATPVGAIPKPDIHDLGILRFLHEPQRPVSPTRCRMPTCMKATYLHEFHHDQRPADSCDSAVLYTKRTTLAPSGGSYASIGCTDVRLTNIVLGRSVNVCLEGQLIREEVDRRHSPQCCGWGIVCRILCTALAHS